MGRSKLNLEDGAMSETWDQMRKQMIDAAIQMPEDASSEVQRAEMHSQAMALLRAFLDEAIRVAEERGLEPMTPEAWRVVELGGSIANDILYSISYSQLPFSMEERAKLNAAEVRRIFHVTHPTPARDLIAEARGLQQALVDKAGFEEAVGRYLQSEFRVPFADRSLLTVAFDLEITAYLKQIYERNFFTRQSVASVMNRAPIVTWLIGRFWALLRFAIIAVAVLAAIHFSWISEQAAFWVVVVAFGLLAGGTIISFVSYLSFRQRWTASKQVLVDLPRAMVGFFGEVHSTGPLSIRRVREQSQKLADMGTVWPGVVWALLDDLEARGVISLHG